jgi:hypothetical protein
MRLPILLVLGGFLAVPAVLSEVAAAATVRADGANRTADCGGGDAIVEGSHNELSFTGGCRGLAVRGDGNTILIELSPGARLDIQGNGNRISYSPGPPPMLRITGSGTELERVEATPPAASAIALTGDGYVLDLDCTGRDVVIRGNRSRYTLRGGCRSVAANGSGNRIQAELAVGARALVEGNDTVFGYAVLGGDSADVTVRGVRSRAERSTAAAPPPQPEPVPRVAPPAAPAQPPAATAAPTPAVTTAPPPASAAVPPPLPAPPFAVPAGASAETPTEPDVPMPSTTPPQPQPLPMLPSAPSETAQPASRPPAAAPAPSVVAAAEPAPAVVEPPAPAEAPSIAAGTPRLPALLRLLGARVVETGTQIAVPAEEVFQPQSDTMRRGGDGKLRQIVQLAEIIHPTATHLGIADPADTDLATRRARALGAWFIARGLLVRQADVSTGAAASVVDVLLLR